MASSATTRLRLEKQGAGENLNTWGAPKLNTVFDLIDSAIAGLSTIALTGNYSLTSTNYAADEARSALLKFTGAGPFTVTIPSVSKMYLAWNACTGAVTLTTGAGATVVLTANEIVIVFCDGSGVRQIGFDSLGIKAYIDAQAWAASAGILPGQTGNAGKFLKTDGTTPSWAYPDVASISDYVTDQATRAAAATSIAVAMAIAL